MILDSPPELILSNIGDNPSVIFQNGVFSACAEKLIQKKIIILSTDFYEILKL